MARICQFIDVISVGNTISEISYKMYICSVHSHNTDLICAVILFFGCSSVLQVF